MQPWQYIALVGAVIAVTAMILPRRKEQSLSASSNSQIEQLELAFEQFMDNMEQEQKDIVTLLQSSLQQLREEQRVKSELISRLEQRNEQLENMISNLSNQIASTEAKLSMIMSNDSLHKQISGHQSNTDSNRIEDLSTNIQDSDSLTHPSPYNSIHLRYPELFEMYDAGKSIEMIAKKLGKNKGEVSLIIQLALQEEKSRYA